MSDKATVDTLRAEALAWHHEAARLREALEEIFKRMHPGNAILDNQARYDAWKMAGNTLGIPLPWTADEADALERFYSDEEG